MFGVRIRLKQYPELNFLKKEKKNLIKMWELIFFISNG